ncbi:MAG: FTR1 family protein [Candidatus Omnitrophica bacterium]|nr:FTR1 family protein [Candidatus Omnitrophota bacterium]
MWDGTVMATLLVVFRETLEAGLIVGIILTVLARLRAMRYAPNVWSSVFLAVGLSLAAGWALSLATQATQGQWEKGIEGVISLVACGVLTHMIFWMDRQAKRIRPEIELRVETAVSRQELAAIMLLPFLAVLREGAETVLFLKAVAIQNSGAVSLAGGLLGGALAVAVTALIFVGGRRVPLKPLFRTTGVVLLLVAAGMLAYGIHELEELGWIPQLVYPVWNINHVLNEKEGLGSFLKALFGYNGNPSLTEVAAYVAYLAVVMGLLRRTSPLPADSR